MKCEKAELAVGEELTVCTIKLQERTKDEAMTHGTVPDKSWGAISCPYGLAEVGERGISKPIDIL